MSQGWTCWRHGSWVLSPGVKTQHSKDYGLSWRPRSQQSGVAVDFQAPKSIKTVTASLPPLKTQVTVRLEVHFSSLRPMVRAWRRDHDLRRHRSSKCCFKDKCSPLIGPHPEVFPENSMPSLEGNPVQDWGHERKPGSGCEGLPAEVRPNITEQTLKLATTCNDWLGLLQSSLDLYDCPSQQPRCYCLLHSLVGAYQVVHEKGGGNCARLKSSETLPLTFFSDGSLIEMWTFPWPSKLKLHQPDGGGSTAGGLKLAHHGFMPFQSVTAQDVIRCLELEVRVSVWGETYTNGNYFICTACKKMWTWSDKGLYYT